MSSSHLIVQNFSTYHPKRLQSVTIKLTKKYKIVIYKVLKFSAYNCKIANIVMGDKSGEEIFQLIQRANFKACNAKINELKKQSPNSSYVRVLEIYAKYKQSPSKFNYEKSLGTFYGLEGTEITGDTRALKLLHNMFLEMGKYDESLHVYEKAVLKYPSFEVSYQWFNRSLDDGNYKMMARACQQMGKWTDSSEGSLSSRDYTFWYALCTVALFKFQRERISKVEQKLLPQLALRSLKALKPFQSTEELIAYCHVCETLFEDKSKEIVDNIWPTLGKSVNLYCKNFLIRHVEDPEQMVEACKSILSKMDDFELICKLIHASRNLNKNRQDIICELEVLVGDSRNTRLARLELDLAFNNGNITIDSLLYYLAKYHNKPCCPPDLARYKQHLNWNEVRETMGKFESDLNHDANAFQMGFLAISSLEAYNKHKSTLSKKAKMDYSSCSVFIMDLVYDLVVRNEPTMQNVLLALSMLENYQTYDPYNYDTSTWIIILYMHLGCVPAAYSRYLDLKVKNLQNDTVDFILYSRFATLFPRKEHDYLKQLQANKYRLYCVSGNRLPQFIQIALEKQAYSKIIGMLDFRSRLAKSSMKWINIIEELQLARLCNDKRHNLLRSMDENRKAMELLGNMQFSDNRDWAILGSKISKDSLPSVLQYMDISQDYISLRLIIECIIEYIPSAQADPKLDQYLQTVLNGRTLEETLESNLDQIEAWSFNVFYDLYKNNGAKLPSFLEQLSSQCNQDTTNWKLTHSYLTKLSTLKTLDSFKRIKDKQLKQHIKGHIRILRDKCDELYQTYIGQLVQTCDNLSKGSSGELLKKLGFVPLSSESLKGPLTIVQKTVRNL